MVRKTVEWLFWTELTRVVYKFASHSLLHCSTSFTTAAYGSHQNVFIRLDPLGRPPSVNSGSYATIASLNKYPLSEYKKSCKLPIFFRNTYSPISIASKVEAGHEIRVPDFFFPRTYDNNMHNIICGHRCVLRFRLKRIKQLWNNV